MSHFVLFDVWTRGVHHYREFFESILELGHHVTIVHYSSIEDPNNTQFKSKYPFFRFVDILEYQYSIDKMICFEQPDLALFLSIDPLIMRAINLCLNRHNIPSVVLYPGLWSTQDLSSKKNLISKFFDLSRKINIRLKQYLFALIHYLDQINMSSNKVELTSNLFHVEFHKAFSKLPIPSLDYQVDLVLVYNQLDKIHAQTKFPNAQHIICGYPELSRLDIKRSISLPSYFSSDLSLVPNVLYIGSGPNSRNGYLSDLTAYFHYLSRVSSFFSSQGIRLIIRPHYTLFDQLDNVNDGTLSLDNSQNIDLLLSSVDYCLTEPSTLSICALFKSIPIFGVRLFELSPLTYGPVFHNNILFNELTRLEYLPRLLTQCNNLSPGALSRNHSNSSFDVNSSEVVFHSIMDLLT